MFASRIRGAAFGALAALVLAAGLAPAARGAALDSTAFAPLIDLKIDPTQPCVTDTVQLVVNDLCHARLWLTGMHLVDGTHAVVSFDAIIVAAPCTPDVFTLPLGLKAAGTNTEFVEVHVHVPADSSTAAGDVVFHEVLLYDVADSCGVAPPPPNRVPIWTIERPLVVIA